MSYPDVDTFVQLLEAERRSHWEDNERLLAENQRLREALEQYADPRNWALSRDDLRGAGPQSDVTGMRE